MEPQPSPAPSPGGQAGASGGPGRTGWSALGALALAGLLKGKALLGGLKLLGLGKVLLSSGSMLAMIWATAQQSGWAFGTLFVLTILVHELGHGWAIRAEGLSAGLPVFIPFFGAFISLKGQPRSSLAEARIALAGPVAGGLASLACAGVYLVARHPVWLAAANAGFLINLFNLTPLSPLDGGRVAQCFSRGAWLVGLAVVGALCVAAMSPPLLLIGVMGVLQLLQGRRAPGEGEAEVTPADRKAMAARYFGLLVALAAGAWFASVLLGR